MPFQIIRNDITKIKADAIVNTANPRPIIGSGTDSAIYAAAGKEQLLAERKKIGTITPGSAVSTPAFALPAKYIIHTVGPAWIDGKHGEETILRKAYDAALNLADQLGCSSIAFPLMAAGSYGFPRDMALSIAISAFTDFLMDHDMEVYLVLFSGKAFSLASSLFSDLKSYIDDNYVEEQTQIEYGSRYEQRRRFENLAPSKDYEESIAFERAEEASAPLGSLEDFLGKSECTFSEYLMDLLRERSGKDSEVYKREVSGDRFYNNHVLLIDVDNIFLYDDRTGAVDKIYDLDDIRTEEDIMRFREKLAEMLVGEYPKLEERRWKRNDRNAYRKN